MPQILIFALLTTVITFIGALIYRFVWIKRLSPSVTPTGFGVFLPVAFSAAAVIFHGYDKIALAFATMTIGVAIYWIDDVKGLSARLRMGISFVTGCLLCRVLLTGDHSFSLLSWAVFFIAAGLFNVVVTNIVNFYDGADLNLATFISLTAACLLAFAPAQNFLTLSAVMCLAFILPFAVLNSRPRMIYLGDSGSFAFACLLTIIAIRYFDGRSIPIESAAPLALPAVDTFYVLCTRIIEKHDLMSRNYLHLYQKLNQQYVGFTYLLPQFVNVGLILFCAAFLRRWGFGQFEAGLLSMICITVPFYFACRRMFIRPSSGRAT